MHYVLLSILAMILFGIELSISKVATSHIPSESVALLRCLSASIIIAIYILVSKSPITASRFSGYACIAGILMGVGFILSFKALSVGPASFVAPIMGLSTAITAIFGILALHEPVTPSRIVGITLACIAIFLISK